VLDQLHPLAIEPRGVDGMVVPIVVMLAVGLGRRQLAEVELISAKLSGAPALCGEGDAYHPGPMARGVMRLGAWRS
jgi:hypothetical protein